MYFLLGIAIFWIVVGIAMDYYEQRAGMGGDE